MRVQFYATLDSPFQAVVLKMPVVPRVGEMIMFEFDGPEFVVTRVCWTPHEDDYDVYVSLR